MQQTLRELDTLFRQQDVIALDAFEHGLAEAPVLFQPAGFFKAMENGLTMFVASEESEDRMGDIIEVDGWDFSEFKKNPVFMLHHDHAILPIGNVRILKKDGKQLLAGVEWDTEDPLAAFVQGKYQRGFMRAVSVGFRPLEMEHSDKGYRFKKQELLELSAVAVPAHPHALAKMMGGKKFSIIVPEIVLVEEPAPKLALSDLEIQTIRAGLRQLKEK